MKNKVNSRIGAIITGNHCSERFSTRWETLPIAKDIAVFAVNLLTPIARVAERGQSV
ncbi:MAG: hypothetical protein HKN47_05555 [Pirellulaceae bacterium]|nr:hypothetical protein [Pirellulaceae bacterium]